MNICKSLSVSPVLNQSNTCATDRGNQSINTCKSLPAAEHGKLIGLVF